MKRYEKEFSFMFWLQLAGLIINLFLMVLTYSKGYWFVLPLFGMLYNAVTIRFMYVTIENTRLHEEEND